LAEISKIFFSETSELTEPKLQMNDHWNVLYQVTANGAKFLIYVCGRYLQVVKAYASLNDKQYSDIKKIVEMF
jgi:hypothetical protein